MHLSSSPAGLHGVPLSGTSFISPALSTPRKFSIRFSMGSYNVLVMFLPAKRNAGISKSANDDVIGAITQRYSTQTIDRLQKQSTRRQQH